MSKDVAELIALCSANKIASKLEHVTEEQYGQLLEKLQSIYPSTTAARLNMFKLELGDEHYSLLVNSPNFEDILEKWEVEKRKELLLVLKQSLRELVPNEEMDEKDLDAFLWTTFKD